MKNTFYSLLILLAFTSCSGDHKDHGRSKEDEKAALNEKRVREFYDKVVNEHNLTLIDSFCLPEFIDHQPLPGYPTSLDGVKKSFADMIAGFPDINFSIDMMMVKGDTVVTKVRMKGTNSAMFMGMPASNKSFDIEGVDIIVMKDGMAKERWGYSEELKMMTQLGMGNDSANRSEEIRPD